MADKKPWFKFYPSDWRADQALRLCSAAARGLWVECMCLMHEAKPYGHLLVNGRPMTDSQLAIQTGIPQDQITALLGELDNAGVSSRNRDGVLYSRRMTRDAQRAADGERYGKQGGNPALTINPTLNPTPPPDPSPRSQSPNPDIPKDFKEIVGGFLSPTKNQKPVTAQQKKGMWQGKVCNWGQRQLTPDKYAQWVEAWANEEKWAKDLAEQFNTQMRAAEASQRAN